MVKKIIFIFSIATTVLACTLLTLDDPLSSESIQREEKLIKEETATYKAFYAKITATEEALATLKAEATINAAIPNNEPAPDSVEQVGCGSEAECSNSGIHRYQMTVEGSRECIGTGGNEVLQEFEFEITFYPGIVSIDQVGSDYLQEFQYEAQNTYVGSNASGSIQKLTFSTYGFFVETLDDDAKCLVYTRTN